MKNEVKILENLQPENVFSEGGADDILSAIREKALDFTPDLTTKKGRDEFTSRAYSVSKSKKFLEKAATKLKSGWKQKVDTVNAELKTVINTLDDLRDEVKKPLVEWEAEQERIAKEEQYELNRLENERLAKIEAEEQKKREDEEEERRKKQAEVDSENKRIKLEQQEAQKKIDEANAEFQRKQDEADAEAQEKQDAIDEQNRIEREAIEKEKAELQAEKDAIEQAKIDEENRIREIEEAKQFAIDQERERVAEEKRIEDKKAELVAEGIAKAKAEKEHIDAIESEVSLDLNSVLDDSDLCCHVIAAIRRGDIRHVTINY